MEVRDDIIFGEKFNPEDYNDGGKFFKTLTLSKLEELVERGFIQREDTFENSPTVGSLIDFCKNFRDLEINFWGEATEKKVSVMGVVFTGNIRHNFRFLEAAVEYFEDAVEVSYKEEDYFGVWYY